MLAEASRRARWVKRRGTILVLSAAMMIVMLGMVAFAVDLGYISTVQTELKRSADAGALAGAAELVNGTPAAEAAVREFVALNPVGGRELLDERVEVEFGDWNVASRTFSASNGTPSALKVKVLNPNQPLFFGKVFGKDQFDVETESVAVYQPRDIMVVLDFSGSMNDDSTIGAFSDIGQTAVEANMLQIYNELGAPSVGNMQWTPVYISSTNTNTIKNTLGVNNKPYPIAGGSWDAYINYVKGRLSPSSYRKRYGWMTWVHYLLEDREQHSETPQLAGVSAQPVTALKQSFQVFLAFLQAAETNDRVGLSIYNSASQTAVLEHGLLYDFSPLSTTIANRQAGHYNAYTNISAGMREARLELENNARPGAFKMMVLMTDGLANRPSNESTARAAVLTEANLADAAGIPIITISLGSGADTALMQQVADITSGAYFVVPGGQTGSQYQEDLEEIFGAVAKDHPLKLVK